MSKVTRISAALLAVITMLPPVLSGETGPVSKRYKALACTAGTGSSGTWAVLDRDGANRQVEPYLSSLGGGEAGTGSIQSPPFTLSAETIRFQVCGHDGNPPGGAGKNIVALADAETGAILRKTPAPGADALQERSWDVKDLKGRKVRIEVHDGIAAGAFAWLGIDGIDAGPELRIDFRPGPIPEGWKFTAAEEKVTEAAFLGKGIPFLDIRNTLVPGTGAAKIPCGVRAKRIFILGCTVEYGTPGEIRGEITILYKDGASDRFPLIVGYSLESENKLLGGTKTIRLHPTEDPFQYYLAIRPRDAAIDRIEVRNGTSRPPTIRGITCETEAAAEVLKDLPDLSPGAEEAAWIETYAISADAQDIPGILQDLKANSRR